jgi:ribosomal-protein-alanine N-acetyltransferase
VIRTQLETERLRLRLFTHNDLQIMFELNSDPEIIKYAEPEPLKNLEEARQRLEEGPLYDYQKYGYGRFAVELKETGKVIGFCSIKYLPEIELPEVGYRYLSEYWGRGIGTEAAKACVFSLSASDCESLGLPEGSRYADAALLIESRLKRE